MISFVIRSVLMAKSVWLMCQIIGSVQSVSVMIRVSLRLVVSDFLIILVIFVIFELIILVSSKESVISS